MIARFNRVLLILTYGPCKGIGGSFTVMGQEYDYFSKLYPTYMLCREPQDGSDEARPSETLRFSFPFLPTRPLRLIVSLLIIFLKLVQYTARYRVTSYHAHDIYVASVAAIAGRLFGIRAVLTVHGPVTYEYANFFGTPWNQFRIKDRLYVYLLWAVERFSYKYVNFVAAVSDFEIRFISTVRTKGVFVVRNGVDLTAFTPGGNKRQIREVLKLPAQKKIVAFVGRIVPKNGAVVIANAIEEVTRRRGDVLFMFVGDGFAEAACKSIIAHTNASDKVIFTGSMKNPVRYFQASDLFVSHLSSLVEGVGVNVLEALSCGLPVIVGSDPVSRSLLKGVAHFVRKDDPSALAEEILEVLGSKSKVVGLREFAEKHLSATKTFERYAQLLFERGDP